MKSILYPFGDKYNFLNNKWWHRLLKVIFYIVFFLLTLIALVSPFYDNVLIKIDTYIYNNCNECNEPVTKDTLNNLYDDLQDESKTLDDIKALYPQIPQDKIKDLSNDVRDMTQSLKDLKATIPSMQSIDDIKGAFPEFSNLDDSVLLDLVETTKNSDNYEDILSVFPELQGGGQQLQPCGKGLYCNIKYHTTSILLYTLFYGLNIILNLSIILLFYFMITLFYYKVVLYVVYGSEDK